MAFADSLKENTKEKELDDFTMKRTVEYALQRVRSYCEDRRADGRAEGYLLGKYLNGNGYVWAYDSLYEETVTYEREPVHWHWMQPLYKGKVRRTDIDHQAERQWLDYLYERQLRSSALRGILVGIRGDDAFRSGYTRQPWIAVRPLAADPLEYCTEIARGLKEKLIADGFSNVRVEVGPCRERYDIVRQEISSATCYYWLERIDTPKVVGYTIKFHVEW